MLTTLALAHRLQEDIDKKLDELLAMRGRKGTRKEEQISILKQLADVTKRPSKLVELLGHIISFNFDIHNNSALLRTKELNCHGIFSEDDHALSLYIGCLATFDSPRIFSVIQPTIPQPTLGLLVCLPL